MVVTFSAADGQSQPDRTERVHTVDHVFVQVLVRVRAAFIVRHIIADKTGGDALGLVRVG